MQMTAFGATTFAYAGPGQAQRTAIGSTAVINNLLGVAAYTSGTTVDYFTRDENKAFISQRRPSATAPNRRTYPLTDRLGSTRTLSNETGAAVRRTNYEPYGTDIPVAGTWTTTTPLKFAGGEADATGLYHFGQRYYDPAIGRWTQRDAINQAADLQQANRYAYVGDSPINRIDLSGMCFLGISCRTYRRASHVARYVYNGASGCLAGAELGGAAGFFVGAPEVGAAVGCVGGAAAGEALPTNSYDGNPYPRFAK